MLKLENLKKVYDGVTILENINLNIEDGEIISILGPSGCGKTTLLNLILGIAEADGGHIVLTVRILQTFQWKSGDLILSFRIMPCSRTLMYMKILRMD